MKRTIRKVLDELSKEKPDLSYIRGMLEVLLDEPDSVVTHSSPVDVFNHVTGTNIKSDEQEIIPEVAKIGRVAPLS